MRFRVQAAHNLLDEAFGASAPDVVARDLLLPLFEQLEETSDPAVIRFAASLFEHRLLGQASGWDRVDGPLVVLACAPREERTLELIGLGLALAAQHCRIGYLGAVTPTRTLRATMLEERAVLAVVSADRDDLTDDERSDLRALAIGLIGAAAEGLALSLGGVAVSGDGIAAAGEAHRRSSLQDDAASPPSWRGSNSDGPHVRDPHQGSGR